MFRNFQELEVILNVYNNKIYSINKALKYAYLCRNFIKVAF